MVYFLLYFGERIFMSKANISANGVITAAAGAPPETQEALQPRVEILGDLVGNLGNSEVIETQIENLAGHLASLVGDRGAGFLNNTARLVGGLRDSFTNSLDDPDGLPPDWCDPEGCENLLKALGEFGKKSKLI